MPIAIPVRKALKAKTLADRNPNLSSQEIARTLGLRPSQVEKAAAKEHFGREKPKSYARP